MKYMLLLLTSSNQCDRSDRVRPIVRFPNHQLFL